VPVRVRLSRRRLRRLRQNRLKQNRLKPGRFQLGPLKLGPLKLGPLKLGRLGTAGRSPRLRRWVLAAVLLAVALVPYPVTGATGAPPAAACREGCRSGAVPSMVRWTATLPGTWVAAPGLTGTVPSSGLAYAATGGGVAVVGVGLTVYAYSAATGALEWQDTLTGFPAGAAIVSMRAWPGEVTAGVSYRPPGRAPQRTEVAIATADGPEKGTVTGRYPAGTFGGAVAGGQKYTVIVGPAAVTSYDNATGRVRWQRPAGPAAQAWRTDGNWLYLAESAGGFVTSAPVTALRRIDLTTGAELVVRPLEGPSFTGVLSTAFDGVVLFSSAAGVTAYSGATGVRLWFARGAVPEGPDLHPRRVYLTEGANLVGADPQTGRVEATASGSAVNGAAGVYVVRHGVALGLDQGGNGDAWGFDLAAERVTLTAPGLPWPHYFVDLGSVGGSADPVGNLVIIAACTQLAPATAAPSGPPASSSSSAPAAPDASPSAPSSPSGSGAPSASAGASASPGSSAPGPDASPSAPVRAGQGCLHPELVALNL
jgi:putative pyrroloquinoline-quinone binding quinoprotein